MKINTIYSEEIEIDDENIINFEDGIPGFDQMKKFAILNIEQSPFKWLQSIEDKDVALPIINPFDIKEDYEFDIDSITEGKLQIKNVQDIVVYSVVVIPGDDLSKMSANLKAPIIVNAANNKAKQMIMENSEYAIKYYILEEILVDKMVGGDK